MKNRDIKYTEDLLDEEEFDIEAILKSKQKHPTRMWFNYKLFLIQVFIVEIIVGIMFSFKKTINKWKK